MGDSEVTSAEVNGLSVETNTGETSEEITRALSDEEDKPEKPDLKKAASELGKKGGKAAAKARAAKAEEAPRRTLTRRSPPRKPQGQKRSPRPLTRRRRTKTSPRRRSWASPGTTLEPGCSRPRARLRRRSGTVTLP